MPGSKLDKAQLILGGVDVALSLTGFSLSDIGLMSDPLQEGVDEANAKLDALSQDLDAFRQEMQYLGEDLMQQLDYIADLILTNEIDDAREAADLAWVELDAFRRSADPDSFDTEQAIQKANEALFSITNDAASILDGQQPDQVVGFLEALLYAANTRVLIALEMEGGQIAQKKTIEELQEVADIVDEVKSLLNRKLSNDIGRDYDVTYGPLNALSGEFAWIEVTSTMSSEFIETTYSKTRRKEDVSVFDVEATIQGLHSFNLRDLASDGVFGLIHDEQMAALGFDKLSLIADNYREMADGIDEVVASDAGHILDGTDGNDRLFGKDGDDVLNALDDEDFLFGRGGNDTMQGGGGADRMEGEGGNDKMYGGKGDDGMVGGAGADRMWGEGNHDQMIGGGGQDVMRGGFGRDKMTGDAGKDRLFGEGGRDDIEGGNGHDWLRGGKGADLLNGGNGDDTLNGDQGADTLIGGDGADVFHFADLGPKDRVADFETGVDRFELDADVFAGLGIGELSANDFRDNGVAIGTDAQIIQDDWALYYDADGTGAGEAQLFAWIAGNPDLDASDFTLV